MCIRDSSNSGARVTPRAGSLCSVRTQAAALNFRLRLCNACSRNLCACGSNISVTPNENPDLYQAARANVRREPSLAVKSGFIDSSGAGTMSEATEKTTTAATTAGAAAPATSNKRKAAAGLTFKRYFTKAGVSPYDEIEWELRLAQITDSKGGVIFEQKDVETPKDWSMTATNIVASKYCLLYTSDAA